MEQQPDMEEVVKEFRENNLDNSQIVTILSSIIKQQLMFGGSLSDKVTFCLQEARKNTKIL
jgi:hypothetical protein